MWAGGSFPSVRAALGRVALSVFLMVPPVWLAVMAVPRLEAGLAATHTEAILSDRRLSYAIPARESLRAESALASALPTDGESEIWRAELLAVRSAHDLSSLETARALALEGLSHFPASTRGWTLLCEIDVKLDRSRAPACMDTAFYVGPFDWYVAERRTILSAYLFPQLDADTQDAAARRLRLVWEDPQLRAVAYEAAREPNGAALVSAAFREDPLAMRGFERGLGGAVVASAREPMP